MVVRGNRVEGPQGGSKNRVTTSCEIVGRLSRAGNLAMIAHVLIAARAYPVSANPSFLLKIAQQRLAEASQSPGTSVGAG
jgi:hypothetical protein